MRFLSLATLVLLLDQVTKYLVSHKMELGQSIPVLDNIFHITYIHNPGAAFGMLAYRTAFFVAITVVVVVAILIFYRRIKENRYLLKSGLALQLGGAVGNLLDRLRYGYVIDFLDFRVWPVFNLADSAIVLGVALVCWELWRMPDKEK
ncbi:signal peptidase II [Calderihabitans maritimus]|uniref:Lipoprotein signal peptidase n=1 Tax=Calderihabitans maritimus TaxID=1246530 RepID=A0A1Z5HTG6_9FIRM|nr:signal peptidase II [Calderihabitans maritimus]GAW92605.1 signal peptidase ii [Calderihabitans maritimus]